MKIILGVILSFNVEASNTKVSCNAIEVYKGNDNYNHLLCSGIEYMNKKKYKDAINKFEKAMQVNLLEFPNFKIYTRLALAYFLYKDEKKAKENIQKAELSLLLYVRIIYCKDYKESYILVDKYHNYISQQYSNEISNLMCGAAYEYIYNATLESIAYDSELIKYFVYVKNQLNYK